ncbi:MAG: ECF transporter S component [Oscillospiraceae bacterium]|nr:ECF transporter S component [Oscillospiraceae bacterium]MBQ8835764.1 ECF transporter S component [Oscillospiraceae bacterium]
MKHKLDVRRMTELALLMAVVLVMAYTPLGYLRTPWGLPITLIPVPVVVGAIVMGPKAGAFLGLVFGLTSFFKTFGDSGMGPLMLEANPVGYFILCVGPRVLVGLLPGMLYKGLKRFGKYRTLSQAVCCFLTPLLNTSLYMSTLWLLFSDTWLAYNAVEGSGFSLLILMLSGVAVNGIVEAVACLVLGTAVCKALIRVLHRNEA